MNESPQNRNDNAIRLISIGFWIAMLVSQMLFPIIVYFTHGELFKIDLSKPFLNEGAPVITISGILAVVSFSASFFIKLKPFQKAAEKQIGLNLLGTILALALCEAVCLFGLITVFAFHNPYFLLWFILGIGGTLLHFPRQQSANLFETAVQ